MIDRRVCAADISALLLVTIQSTSNAAVQASSGMLSTGEAKGIGKDFNDPVAQACQGLRLREERMSRRHWGSPDMLNKNRLQRLRLLWYATLTLACDMRVSEHMCRYNVWYL